MPLQLKIVSEHKEILGDDYLRQFREEGGTIGRALENDWILPDPDRYISSNHATVDYQSGAYYLADVSSNGVYVNEEEEPLGKGNPRRLFDGDRLRMGDFEFEVTLDEGEDLEMPPPPPMTVVPDHIEQLVPEEPLKTGVQLLDEEEITGDEEFQSALFGSPTTNKASDDKPAAKSEPDNPFAPPPSDEDQNRIGAEQVLDAFLAGLGIERGEIHPSTDPLEVMGNAGRVLKEFVDGISELLACRAGVKSMFRLDQTTVLPRHNNPLKLADNSRESMMQLLVGKEGEYLAPVDAVREVCRDLRFHHDAVMDAMTSAFLEFSDRFDPDELQENFDRTLNKKPLIKAVNQLKYWQLYCDLYPIMTQPGSGQFPHHFGEEFVRAYEKQIAEFKRLERQLVKKSAKMAAGEKETSSYDVEELADQTEESTYAEQF
jgi:type VI secretion system protein